MLKEDLLRNDNTNEDHPPPPYFPVDVLDLSQSEEDFGSSSSITTGLAENVHNFVQGSGPLYKQLDSDLGDSTTQISCSHDDIRLPNGFQGQECRLKTSHGAIIIGNSITASHSIDITSSHKDMEATRSLLCRRDISIKSSHGTLKMHKGAIIVANSINIQTAHAPLVFDPHSVIDASYAKFGTTHNKIFLGNVSIQSELTVKTSHGPIELHIKNIYSNSARIKVTTSHAPVSVYLPSTFSGRFYIKTSKAETKIISQLPLASEDITFTKNLESYKEGSISGASKYVELRIETSSKPVHVYIG